MLSDIDILQAVEAGELVIEPFDKASVRPAGLTFRLGPEILEPKPQALIDLNNPDFEVEYNTHEITPDKPFVLQPMQFVLGHTAEVVTIGSSLGFLIEGRSTLARLGVSVVQSSMIVDSGIEARPLTFNIFNAGPSPVTLYGGMRIGRAIMFQLNAQASRAYDNGSRYAGQRSGAGRPLFGASNRIHPSAAA